MQTTERHIYHTLAANHFNTLPPSEQAEVDINSFMAGASAMWEWYKANRLCEKR